MSKTYKINATIVVEDDGVINIVPTDPPIVVDPPVVVPPVVVVPPIVVPPVVVPPVVTKSFMFGVWLQAPEDQYNGKTVAQNYKDIGINTFVGLWIWPSEEGMYSGYALASMQAIKNAGMKVYAGDGAHIPAAIEWIKAHPEFNDTFKGFLLGDEPDMNKVNQSTPGDTFEWAQPNTWKATGDSIRAANPTLGLYGAFGKGFACDPWNGYKVSTTQAEDFAKYVEPLTIMSADYYGITDPWEVAANHGIWTYGRAVVNQKKYAGSKPVVAVIETSAPWPDATSVKWMYQRMQANLVMPIVWNVVISGAEGICYFCHDFSPSGNLGKYATFKEPGIADAVKVANASVMAFETILLSPTITTTIVKSSGAVDIISLTKQYNGKTYIFAMGNGNSTYRTGLAVDGTITIPGLTGTQNVTVVNESRTIVMTNGKFVDHFNPYAVHIYQIG